MQSRLQEFILYKTNGHQTEFAKLMGWSPQYLHRMLKGSIGIQPVVAMLEKFQELNARWLLLGEGAMIANVADNLKARLLYLLEVEKYIPVMTHEELRKLQNVDANFDDKTIKKWERMLNDKNDISKNRFEKAMQKQEDLCRIKSDD